jgi:hypothetical protein
MLIRLLSSMAWKPSSFRCRNARLNSSGADNRDQNRLVLEHLPLVRRMISFPVVRRFAWMTKLQCFVECLEWLE